MANPSRQRNPGFNLYDIYNNPEHDLWEEYITEFIEIAGIQASYYRLDYDSVDLDEIYGEPTYRNKSYTLLGVTKIMAEVTEEPSLVTTFGVNSEDIIMFGFCPKKKFRKDLGISYEPKWGDVIKFDWNDRSYEVVDVGKEQSIFSLSKRVWNFILKPYRFSEESDSAKTVSSDMDTTHVTPISAWGDNKIIESESNDIDNYGDVDTGVYGY